MTRQESRTQSNMRLEYKAQTRQRLAEAAVVEFEEQGYASCTIDDIARRAGTSRATFYVHFDGKMELIDGLWDVARRPLTSLYRELAREKVRDLTFLQSWLTRTFAFYEENRPRLLAIHQAISLEKELAEVYYQRLEELADFVTPLIHRRESMTDAEVHFQASLLTIQHERLCNLWILRGMPFDRDVAIPVLAQEWHDWLGTR